MTGEEHKALVVRPAGTVGTVSAGAGSVLSRVVSDALVLARSHSLASARFRVGDYEFREADYQQILLWAKALEKTPETIIETLENTSFDVDDHYVLRRVLAADSTVEAFQVKMDRISFQVKDGSIFSLVWDHKKLPSTEFVSVKDLKICEIAFIDWPDKLTTISCHLPTLRRLVLSNQNVWLLKLIFGDADGEENRHIGLRELDLSNVPRLTHLCCLSNLLTRLDLSNVPKLTNLHCWRNELTELDLSNVPELAELDCGSNQLTKLDLSNVPELAELRCWNNKLTELNLSNVPKLAKLGCWINELTELDLSNVPELAELYCRDNELSELDLSKVPKLTEFDCGDNKLTEARPLECA